MDSLKRLKTSIRDSVANISIEWLAARAKLAVLNCLGQVNSVLGKSQTSRVNYFFYGVFFFVFLYRLFSLLLLLSFSFFW